MGLDLLCSGFSVCFGTRNSFLIHCQLVLEVGMVALNRHISNKLPTQAFHELSCFDGEMGGGLGVAEVCVKYAL